MNQAARAKRTQSGFLPQGATALFRKLAWQGAGLAVFTLGLALAAMLGSFDPQDPSWNTAAAPGRAAHNMVGLFGAYLSDILLQMAGLTAWLPVLALFAWGGKMLVTGAPAQRFGLRLVLLVTGLLLLAVGLSALPAHFPLVMGGFSEGLGGSAGKLLLEGLAESLRLVGLQPLAWVVAALCAALGTVGTLSALGLTIEEWRRFFTVIAAGPRFLLRLRERDDRWGEDEQPRSPPMMRREPAFEEDQAPVPPPPRTKKKAAAPPEEEKPAMRVEPLVAPRTTRIQAGKREEDSRQGRLDLPDDSFEIPPLRLLAPPPENRGPSVDGDALKQNDKLLVSVLDDFGVNGQITTVRPGPVVTLYELEPAPGTKTSRVIGLADDIARSMSALSVRIATVPGRSVIGIEMPNQRRETVYLRELLADAAFDRSGMALTLVLGKDIGGQPVMVDLARMPHLLIAGTTGSGKSVAINTMILSLLYRLRPDQCRMIMIDPKMLELSVYDGIPHLLAPVVTEPGKAVVALKWAVREMEDRYRAMSQLGVRNISGYNQRLAEARSKGEVLSRTVQTGFDPDSGKPIYEEQPLALEPLPFIVVVVDEMADLMLVAGKDIEAAVQRLAQMARAAGIHLIMATQRPSVDVITGTIKANFPSRISFQVSSKIDSRTILGEQGAEQLLGQGDMLYMAAGGRITRVHGPFVSDQEVETVVEHLRSQGEPAYVESVTEEDEPPLDIAGVGGGNGESGDDLYDQAVALVAREGKASTSFVQRHLQIGYNRAARIIERMEQEGMVSRANHVGKREVLLRRSDEDS
jgi:S-DNA-T family DNA segregation ATPase FtsK/SpoIIIE